MTAEFAVVLPTVVLVLVTSLQVFGMQANRIKLTSLAFEGARALARGESSEQVQALVTERLQNVEFSFEYFALSVCVDLTLSTRVLGTVQVPVTERGCARKGGL